MTMDEATVRLMDALASDVAMQEMTGERNTLAIAVRHNVTAVEMRAWLERADFWERVDAKREAMDRSPEAFQAKAREFAVDMMPGIKEMYDDVGGDVAGGAPGPVRVGDADGGGVVGGGGGRGGHGAAGVVGDRHEGSGTGRVRCRWCTARGWWGRWWRCLGRGCCRARCSRRGSRCGGGGGGGPADVPLEEPLAAPKAEGEEEAAVWWGQARGEGSGADEPVEDAVRG